MRHWTFPKPGTRPVLLALRETAAWLPGSALRRALPAPRRGSLAAPRQSWQPGGSLLFAEAPVPVERATPIIRPRVKIRAEFPAALLLAGGIGLLAWVYALRFASPFDYLLFWSAWGLCLAAIFLYALRSPARAHHHLIALAAYGAMTWLPQYLRSPTQALFIDELFHLQIVQQIAELGRTQVPITFYAIPGEYPGLEFSALMLAGATGLPLDWAARVLTLVLHMAIPGIAYLTARGLGMGRRGAFLAALVYVANASYYYFHAVFSYETLGVTFVLALWVLMSRRQQRFGWRDFGLAAPILAALAATHHFSSYILAGTVVVAWLTRLIVGRFGRGKAARWTIRGAWWRRRAFDLFTLLAVTLPILWIAFFTTRTASYLSSSLIARINGIVTAIQKIIAHESESRALFHGSPLPQLERMVDFLYVPLLISLGLVGLGLILWRLGVRHAPAFSLALAPCGPLAWFISIPAVLTPASELAYRSWPFLFLGLALYVAVALVMLAGWLDSKDWGRRFAWPAAAALVAILLFGSVGIGDNQAGRFPLPEATKAAGPETITPDLTSAARWLEQTGGRYNRVVGDGTTQAVFATVGFQRATDWGYWTPFFATTPSEVSQYMRSTATRYLTVDRRITQLPPRYGYYFSDAELYLPEAQIPGRALDDPLPPALLDKFDRTPDLARIYDNGNIQIFQRRTPQIEPADDPAPAPAQRGSQ